MIDPVTVITQLFSPPELTALVLICAISGVVVIYAPSVYGFLVSLGILVAGTIPVLFYIIMRCDDR